MKLSACGLAVLFSIGLANPGLADDLRKTEHFAGTHVAFEFAAPYYNVTLTVIGPNDFQAKVHSSAGVPAIDLQAFGSVADGRYTYQMTASSGVTRKAPTILYNGRHVEDAVRLQSVSTSGTFVVTGGTIVPHSQAPRAARRDLP